MKFDRVELHQFKCYGSVELDVGGGVTVIHGVNGSGKSTLLDACFFALYGAATLDGATLDEVITTGHETSTVSLVFTHEGDSYAITRELRVRDGSAHTARCTLETPAGVIEGARDVAGEVARLLRMDADAFLNCAYVRQGEVNKLIHAAPSTRQDMIDELLQLGVLETYRDRASHARRGIASIRDDRRGHAGALADQIANKEEKGLPQALNDAETDRADLDQELERLESQIEKAESTRVDAQEVIDRYEERRTELADVEDAVTDLREAITDTESEIADAASSRADLQDERKAIAETIERDHADLSLDPVGRSVIETELEELTSEDDECRNAIEAARISLQEHQSAAEQLEERAAEREAQAASRLSDADDREATIDTDLATLNERKSSLEDLRAEHDQHTRTIREAGYDPGALDCLLADQREHLQALQTEKTELEARSDTLLSDIDEAESLRAAGKCPTCGQDVHEAPVIDELEADRTAFHECQERLETVREEIDAHTRELDTIESLVDRKQTVERLADRIDALETLITEREATVEARRDDIEMLRAEAATDEDAAAKARAEADDHRAAATNKRERIAELNAERQAIKARRNTVAETLERYDRLDQLETEIERLATSLEQLRTINAERRERLAALRDRRQELADSVDEDRVESARRDKQRADKYLAQATNERDRLHEQRDAVIDRIGRIRNELEELEDLRDQHAAVRAEHAAIDTLHAETETIESMYAELREELRERNVTILEQLVNEVFDLLYQNDAYDRIELDRSYRITMYQKDGEPLHPDQLSGGERALFNLSLRCAIYRLLSEGIEGTGPLPPFILDEPTVYLDAGHVHRLVELIDAMRRFGVEQILVVTHDDELLRAADAVVSVAKNATTNRSTAETAPAQPMPSP